MAIEYAQITHAGLSKQIADAIRAAIVEGKLAVDERLPSEYELAERFNVSRPTVREALKRLAAQNLIRTTRGPLGGAFVNRISWSQAHDALVTTATLLIGMNEIDFEAAIEARFALASACIPLAAARIEAHHLADMRRELTMQRKKNCDDEAFCASDVRFHRAIVDAAQNPVLSFQMAGVIEAMQPLMNMIITRLCSRQAVIKLHQNLLSALEQGDAALALEHMDGLRLYMLELAEKAQKTHRKNLQRKRT